MSKLAVVSNICDRIEEINGTLHIVYFHACIKTDLGGFNGDVICEAFVDSGDNANKVRDSYIDAVVLSASNLGITLTRSQVIVPQIFQAP